MIEKLMLSRDSEDRFVKILNFKFSGDDVGLKFSVDALLRF